MQINTHQAQFETQPQQRNASGRYETESYDKKDKKLNFTLQESAATTCKHKKLKLKQVQEVAAAQSDNECEKLAYTGFYKGIADERKYFKIFPEICVCVQPRVRNMFVPRRERTSNLTICVSDYKTFYRFDPNMNCK